MHPGRQGVQHLQIKAALHPVGVDGVQHDFPRAVSHAPDSPFHGVDAGILPAPFGKEAEGPVHPLHVHAEDHALVPVAFRRRGDDGGVCDGPGVDADLVRAAFQHPVEILQPPDAAPHGEWNEDLGGHPAEDVREQPPPLGGGGDVIEHQLVGPGVVVEPGQLHRVRHVPEPFEVGPLHHPSVPHVQAGDDPLG